MSAARYAGQDAPGVVWDTRPQPRPSGRSGAGSLPFGVEPDRDLAVVIESLRGQQSEASELRRQALAFMCYAVELERAVVDRLAASLRGKRVQAAAGDLVSDDREPREWVGYARRLRSDGRARPGRRGAVRGICHNIVALGRAT